MPHSLAASLRLYWTILKTRDVVPHQLPALSAAGFNAVAVDMRGYGQSDRPEAIDQYTLLHLVGDIVGLLDALGVQRAVIAGHDWGAVVAWHAALLRPEHAADLQGIVNDIKCSGGAGLFVTRTKPSIPQRLDRSPGSQLDQ